MQRRKFLKSTAAISTVTVLSPNIAFGSQANSTIKIGLIGCGNRGTGVIASMSRNANIHILAIADIFKDKLDLAKPRLDKVNQEKGLSKIDVENAWDSGMLRDNRQPLTAEQRSAGAFSSGLHDADTNKQKAFIRSIETRNYLNETQTGANSTLSAILGREAAISGNSCSWEEMRISNALLPHGLELVQF